MKSVFCAGAGIQSVLFFLNDGYLSATLACGSGVSPRTVRWGGTLLPQAVGRAMEWPDSCPRRKLPHTPSPAVSRTSTAVSSMQALEQRSRLSTRRVSASPRVPSSAAQRTGRFSSPAGQASTTGFAASSAAGVNSGSTTASTAGSRYAPGCGATSSFASSS